MNKYHIASFTRAKGFSLLEVLVAVVVLSTGLLALAALQGGLSRASADAKVRTQVAALLQARLDQVRTAGYAAAANSTDTCATNVGATDGSDWVPQVFCTQNGLANLTAVQTVQTWTSAPGAGSFAVGAPASPDHPQFKRITIAATWTDATGATSRRLAMASDMSELGLKDSLIPPPDDSNLGGQTPIVRQFSPATAGVIPIAMGGNDATAATNPRPELVGSNKNEQVVGTTFNVLTYTNEGSSVVRVQRRIENSLIKCSCQYGAGGSNLPEIFRAPQWPAVWNGDFYEVYQPSTATAAPGAALGFPAGPTPNVDQSPLCQECCRDHHDGSNTVKFDPERTTDGVSKFRLDNNMLVAVNAVNNQTYLNACRVIRVDGMWRTAADTYQRQFGLLETETVNGAAAKTGLPTAAATTAYTTFVRDYTRANYNVASPSLPPASPTVDGEAMFNETGRGLNTPATVLIAAASNSDFRYLHGRGLFVDYLEPKARQRIADVLADDGERGRCPRTGSNAVSDRVECILPYLPFTTINLTEIARWVASDTNVLTVNSGNLLSLNPEQPSGSRTLGSGVGNSDNTGSNRKSSSGVAVLKVLANSPLKPFEDRGVDPTDDTDRAADAQPFQVGGELSTGDHFDVRVSGGGLNPFVHSPLAASGECTKPAGGDHRCSTNITLNGPGGSITLSNYWVETSTPPQSVTTTCSNGTATADISVPIFRNFVVASATLGGVGGTINQPANENKISETTTVSFASIPANSLILVTLSEQAGSPTPATVDSCTTNGGGNKINNATWNKPWCPITAGNPFEGCKP